MSYILLKNRQKSLACVMSVVQCNYEQEHTKLGLNLSIRLRPSAVLGIGHPSSMKPINAVKHVTSLERGSGLLSTANRSTQAITESSAQAVRRQRSAASRAQSDRQTDRDQGTVI